MPMAPADRQRMGKLARKANLEIEALEALGKIDWGKLFALLIELMPLILTFFAEPENEE